MGQLLHRHVILILSIRYGLKNGLLRQKLASAFVSYISMYLCEVDHIQQHDLTTLSNNIQLSLCFQTNTKK